MVRFVGRAILIILLMFLMVLIVIVSLRVHDDILMSVMMIDSLVRGGYGLMVVVGFLVLSVVMIMRIIN